MSTDPINQSHWRLSLLLASGPRPTGDDEERSASDDPKADGEFQAAFREFLGLPPLSDLWVEVDLSNSLPAKLIDWLEQQASLGRGHVVRGRMHEILDLASPHWYALQPVREKYPIDRNENGVECVGQGWAMRMSDEFVRHISELHLTGVRFVAEPRTSRFRQRREWFEPIPTSAMGRGADHPWVDREAYLRDADDDERLPESAHGIRSFGNNQMRPDAPGLTDQLKRLINLFAPSELYFEGARRVPRQHLPITDFAAFLSSDRRYDLCVRAGARDLLCGRQLLAPNDFVPVIVIEHPNALDPALEAPVDVTTIPTVARALQREIAGPSPDETLSKLEFEWTADVALENVVRLLESRREHKLISETQLQDALAQIGMPLPYMWRTIILAAGEWGYVGGMIPPPQRWIKLQNLYSEWFQKAARVPGARYLFVGQTPEGDAFALEIPEHLPSPFLDTRVLFFNHEVSRFTEQWPTITQFIEAHCRSE